MKYLYLVWSNLKRKKIRTTLTVLSIVIAFVLSGLVILAIGESPVEAVRTMVTGALGSTYGWGYTLYYTTNFIFTGLAVSVAFHARMFNIGGEGIRGWGVPMATDIAFAVGVLVLLGSRVPKSLLTFLVALAIVDDLGAVAVIAIFYTENLAWDALAIAALLFGLLIVFNRLGIRNPIPYFIVGTFVWMAFLQSGVHATVAGILTAWTIPARSKFDVELFEAKINALSHRMSERRNSPGECTLMRDEEQRRGVIQTLLDGIHLVETPLQRLEHSLHIPVAFLIVPLFALANAGIPLQLDQVPSLVTEPITLGIMVGLILGKLVGIAGLSLLAVKLGIGQLPEGTTAKHLIGVGLLGGIGFTMSIFIAELGFRGQPDQLLLAKTGILFASVIAGTAGYLWLRFTSRSA